ncbi:MAG: hypothetical protein LBF37_00385 [Rickettsiales bacterium]|nr:hypothetical protein [Rickettsiales bacterium]
MKIKTDRTESNFGIKRLSRGLSLSVFLFSLFIIPAHADWCKKSGNNIIPCDTTPNNWIRCGTFDRQPVWCPLSESTKNNSTDSSKKQSEQFYVGFSIAYPAIVFGGIESQYKNDTNAFRAPGSFDQSDFQTNGTIPLQFSFGTVVSENFRVDVSYLRYSDLSMKMTSNELLPIDPLLTTHTGGLRFLGSSPNIVSNVVLLSAYYNFLDSFIGRWALRPYIGAGIGMASNSVSDYTVFDNGAYIFPEMKDTVQPVETVIGFQEISALHKGGTTTNVAWAVELGVTYNLTDRALVDFFGRYVNLGRVETSNVIVSQWDILARFDSIPVGPPTNLTLGEESVSNFTDWQESGTLSVFDVGIRIRFLF